MNYIKLFCKIAFNTRVSRFLDNEFHVTFALQLARGFIRKTTAGCSGDMLIDRGTVQCTKTSGMRFASSEITHRNITAIYIDRISLPITIATRQTTRSFLRLNRFMFPNSRYKNCNCIWSSSLIKKYILLKYSLFKNWQKITI